MKISLATWILILSPAAILIGPDLYAHYLDQSTELSFSSLKDIIIGYNYDFYNALSESEGTIEYFLNLKAFFVGTVISTIFLIIALIMSLSKKTIKEYKPFFSRNIKKTFLYKFKKK